jgi:hypothetical protein
VSIGNGTEKKSKVEITKELLHQKYSYCPIDIAQPLVHNKDSAQTKRGDPAGTLVQSYYRVRVDGRSISLHRAVWLYKHPGCYKDSEIPPILDHINRNNQDNRYENLRPVSRNFNNFNIKRREGSSSNYRGVSWAKREGKWTAQIKVGGKHRRLGTFPGTPEGEVAAALAWDRAAFEVYGEDAIPLLNFPKEKANYMGLNSNEQLEFGFIVGNGNDRQQHLDFSALLGTGTEDGGVRRI